MERLRSTSSPNPMARPTMRPHDHTALPQFFHDHGLRCTRQRELIYSALSHTTAHPTAEDLHRTVRHDEPGLSLATVYNTLDTFVDRGLCRKIPSAAGNGPSRYDADTHAHAHVILDDGTTLNERLLAAGLARADDRFSHQWDERYLLIEDQARKEKVGMWARR